MHFFFWSESYLSFALQSSFCTQCAHTRESVYSGKRLEQISGISKICRFNAMLLGHFFFSSSSTTIGWWMIFVALYCFLVDASWWQTKDRGAAHTHTHMKIMWQNMKRWKLETQNITFTQPKLWKRGFDGWMQIIYFSFSVFFSAASVTVLCRCSLFLLVS